MKEKDTSKSDSVDFRKKAEKILKDKPLKNDSNLSESETIRLVHELQVHQIELEMQNEELEMAKEAAEIASQKYSELYDFAPSGYFTLTREGKIIESNFCGSRLLGKDRNEIKNNSFGLFISPDTKSVFNHFIWNIFNNQTQETCEVTLSLHDNTTKYVFLTGNITLNGSQCIVNLVDITDLKQTGEALRESQERNRAIILQTAMDGFWLIDMQGHLLEVNETYCQMSGYSMLELLSMNLSEIEVCEANEDTAAHMEKVISLGEDRFETQHRRKDGSIFDVEISAQYQHSQGGRFVAFLHDITGRKMEERYREMTKEILQILNEPGEISELIQHVLSVLKSGAGVDAMGIRLKEGDDFPYISQKGFSRDFLLSENTLINRSIDGDVCRDKNGNVRLACTCGLVISGNKDPDNPFFTPGGSWWTNNSLPLLDIPSGEDSRFQPRNRCIHQGYASVALVPIRNKEKIVGLIQLNDLHKDRFNRNTIEKLEGIASHIGAAIMRKHAEETLRESEKRRLSILETAMDGFWLVDIHGKLLEVNETYCKMSGYSLHELLSMRISDLEVVDSDDDIAARIQQIIVRGEDRFESRHRRKDGSIFDVEISIQFQTDEGGQFVTFLHDITERKKAEENLRQSEERYKILFQGNHSVMLLIDPETGEIKDANPVASRFYGWTASEFRSKNISDINTLSRQEVKAEMQKAKEEKRNHFLLKHKLANGKVRDVEIFSGPIKYGETTLLYSIIHDITERRQVEEALKDSELKFRKYIDFAPHGIFVANEKGEYIEVNSVASKITGYSKEELLSMKIINLVPEESLKIAGNHFNRVVNEGYASEELPFIRKDGTTGYWSVDAVKLSDNRFLGFVVDITERKQIEWALQESEERVRFKLQSILSPEGSISDLDLNDIIDAPSIQKLMDNFFELAQVPVAIIDKNGKVLVGSGWQDICTKFHRVHPEACKNCLESDVLLTKRIPEGEFSMYKCKNKMWDMATPLIIGGEHKGNLFLGQFFFDNEQIDEELFRKQAGKFGFEEQEYIDALNKAPRLSKQKLDQAKSFFLNLSLSISQLSYSNIKLARAIAQQKIIEDALRQSQEFLNKAQEISNLGSWSLDLITNELTWSDEIYRIFGLYPKEFPATYEGFLDAVHPDDRDFVNSEYTNSVLEDRDSYEIEHRIVQKSSGELRFVYEKCEHIRDISGKIIRSVGMVHDITARKQSAEAILENERLLRESQAVGNIGSYSVNLVDRTWKATTEVYNIFGIDEKFSHSIDSWVNCIHPDFKVTLVNDLFNGEAGSEKYEHEYKIYRINDGQVRWVHGLGKFEFDSQQKTIRLIGTIQDITIRKAKEEALRKLNKTLAALSKSSQAMSKSVDEAEYLKQVCRIIVNDADFEMVWIGFAEDDEAKTIRPMASAGFNDDYIETIKISWADSPLGHGPTGTAVRTGKISKCNNILTDPDFEPWREQALKRGFASSIVFPLITGDKTFGAITIYSKAPESFLDIEINMLAELANDLAHGITTIRLRAAHKFAEQALILSHSKLEVLVQERTSELQFTNDLLKKEINIRMLQEQNLIIAEEKYRTVADFTYDWEYWMNVDGSYNYVSPSCERITGYKAEEFIQNPGLVYDIIYPEDLEVYQYHKQKEALSLQGIRDTIQDGSHEIQFRIVRLDGEVRWMGHVWQPIYDKTGLFIGIRGSNQDITIRKKTEQLLKTSNQKYKLLSENITDGIFICRNGLFEYINLAMHFIFGYKGNELIGKHINQLVLPEYLKELNFIDSMNDSVNQKKNVEIECFRKDQSIVLVEFLFNHIATEDVIYGVVHDITEKKQLQKNIVKAIIKTEEKERAIFSKELHDGLGPLLSTIKLYLQWSERSKSNKSRGEIIQKTGEILEDALTAVKEISNKLSPHLLINYGLCSALQSFIGKLEETSVLQIAFDCKISKRLGDEIEATAYRAVIECINNSIKHSGAKNITINLHENDNHLNIEYRDNGIGFDLKETLAIKKGLGLFNLQTRIQTIGGKITMFSKPGHGVYYQIIINL